MSSGRDDLVKVQLEAIAGAPAFKKKKLAFKSSDTFATVVGFIRKGLKLSSDDTLFCYVNGSFAPSLTDSMGALKESFLVGKALVVNYSTSKAWG
jgi:ubiquitin-like protein ATG12